MWPELKNLLSSCSISSRLLQKEVRNSSLAAQVRAPGA